MIDALFNNTNYVAAKRLLDATVARQQAISSNLANLETPNYKRIDLAPSFSAELQQALATGSIDTLNSLQPKLETDPSAVAQSADGNTVNLETELTNLQQNSLAHTLETQLVSATLLRLQTAITGRSV